ncbi:translation initiation factor eIF3 subunit g [Coniosporium uncinatum]|uniref:Translation initiation factor eIF3 subunit g n=1 Tax=Coniosporium uncinatum TaxID=93489 RepID=A0ACC3DZY1_9PEZI|nr:translation initiation factor eIF3 subunit g [Coniosporium uncinatum]
MAATRTDWADDEETIDLPPPSTTQNKDGTETQISYHINEQGQKVKTTRRIRRTKVAHMVNPRVAERRQWAKFGQEAGRPAGPQSDTTTVGENIDLRLSTSFKANQTEEKNPIENKKGQLKDTKIKCRLCSGEHWTSKCPFKDTLDADGSASGPGLGEGDDPIAGEPSSGGGGLGVKGSYVPPHMRKGGAGAGERMGGGKFGDRDDLATLRVTNVSEFAEEQDLRDMFSRFGHVTRVFLAKDRETGRAKGFAFVSFADRTDAAKACEKMDGYGYGHLILRVEFAKKST